MPWSGRSATFMRAFPSLHHAARGVGQTNPRPNPLDNNTQLEAEVFHQPGTCYCEGPATNGVFYNDFLQIGFSSWSESHLLEAIANYIHVPCREDVQQNEHFGGNFMHVIPPTISPVDIFQQGRLKSSSSDFSKSFGSAQSCESLLYMFWPIRKQNMKTNIPWNTLTIPQGTLSILLTTTIFFFSLFSLWFSLASMARLS